MKSENWPADTIWTLRRGKAGTMDISSFPAKYGVKNIRYTVRKSIVEAMLKHKFSILESD